MEEENITKRQRTYKVIMLVLLTAFITFMITSLSMYTGITEKGAVIKTSDANNVNDMSDIVSYLNKIKTIVDKNYLWNNKIDNNKVKESIIKGYVNGLGDKYTEYITKEEMKAFTENITGTFEGIGIYMIADEKKGIVVYYPIPDTPAEKAGIQAGDIIKKVDGVEYGYEKFNEIADHIKGKENTSVKITVERNGKEIEFEITRKIINTNPITTEMLENKIGYLTLPSFDSETSKKIKEKIEALIKEGATSLIIDLRNNGGGIVDEATKIADYFLDKDKIIMTTKDNKNNEEVTKSKNSAVFSLPVVVLANENSASASEIFIGALKDNERAKIIGKTTYGKGVIQSVISLADGSGLKITTSEYYTPNGSAIHEIGIKPDIEVNLPEKENTNIYSVEKENDTQLKKAIEELKK